MRSRFLRTRIHPAHLFAVGMLCIPGYLFENVLWVRLAQLAAYGVLAVLNGKRIRWLYFVIMIGSITLFNLLTPIGRVLARVGPFAVTSGALDQGLLKGLAIVGLVFISLFSIRPDLRLPGRLGGLIGRVFFYYERVLDGRKSLRTKNLFESLDETLGDLFPPDGSSPARVAGTEPTPVGATKTTLTGYLVSAGILLLSWVPLIAV